MRPQATRGVFLREIVWPSVREKKEQQSRVFFDVIFDIYTHVDNREESDSKKGDEFRWDFIAAVRK